MSPTSKGELGGLFSTCRQVGPFGTSVNPIVITESVAVSSHAAAMLNAVVNTQNMVVGIDVGGSTSDLFIVGQYNIAGQVPRTTLMRQSSVRLAAGEFFRVAQNSQDFKSCLHQFHHNCQQPLSRIKLNIDGLQNQANAANNTPFYLNSIFDQLESIQDRNEFYENVPNSIFILPAYITGALLYYSGKLLRKVFDDTNDGSLDQVNTINLTSFGKGGRLFEWLLGKPLFLPTANQYYINCFSLGLGHDIISERNINVQFHISLDGHNFSKSEVARGITLNNPVVLPAARILNEEIIAEKGMRFLGGNLLEEFGEAKCNYFEQIAGIDIPNSFDNFDEFFNIFISYVIDNGISNNITDLRSAKDMIKNQLVGFITREEEYVNAVIKKQQNPQMDFEYKAPFFIMECLCYLHNII